MARYGRNGDRRRTFSIGARREGVKGRKRWGEGSVCNFSPLTLPSPGWRGFAVPGSLSLWERAGVRERCALTGKNQGAGRGGDTPGQHPQRGKARYATTRRSSSTPAVPRQASNASKPQRSKVGIGSTCWAVTVSVAVSQPEM